VASDGVRGAALSDLEQGGAAFADVGAGVVVAVATQLLKLFLGEGKGAALWHRGILLVMFRYPHFTEFGCQNSLEMVRKERVLCSPAKGVALYIFLK
jgi:hypothetical protein